MVAREDIPSAAHVGGQLVDFIELAIDGSARYRPISKISDDKCIGVALTILVALEVNSANPQSFTLEASDKMPPDKAPSA